MDPPDLSPSLWHLSIMSFRSVKLEPCRIVQGSYHDNRCHANRASVVCQKKVLSTHWMNLYLSDFEKPPCWRRPHPPDDGALAQPFSAGGSWRASHGWSLQGHLSYPHQGRAGTHTRPQVGLYKAHNAINRQAHGSSSHRKPDGKSRGKKGRQPTANQPHASALTSSVRA